MVGCGAEVMVREVLVIDDDEVSRELLLLFLAEAGFEGVSAVSGDEGLAMLRESGEKPFAVLTDMRMPGICGNALATELRNVCGNGTRVIAMSGSAVAAGATECFDGFLLKPIGVERLRAALEGGMPGTTGTTGGDAAKSDRVLNEATYSSLAQSMPEQELLKLYGMCIDDAVRRVGLMRAAVSAGDSGEYERAAHAIKGGCGMVGAAELAELAGQMEQNGIPAGGDTGALEQFLTASTRLRRILDARVV